MFTGNETLAVLHARRLAAALYFVGPEAVCSTFLVSLVSNFYPTGLYKLIMHTSHVYSSGTEECNSSSLLTLDCQTSYSFVQVLTGG